ncbi:SAM-dependent methyltransferase [Actinomadura rugatobispora]|uniref:SAM-dependent methyltransferase n=1 Tax=Actinomadura rugatobispora TaxID=1994 RepID=A0ABW1A234_9ACTN|nr:SAM-dependent methyltransferase [Actinomadura rugatobispora]
MQDDTSNSPAKINTEVPHSARIWNYWLGGTDNYAVDRAAGDQYVAVYPQIKELARAGRYFLARAIRFLTAEAGVRQFLDIGTGLPTVDNTHEVAQRIAPETRVVYVDNDPLVLAHARALLTGTAQGATTYIDADLHHPEKIIERARPSLDFSQPIGLMLMGVMGHIIDNTEAHSIVARLVDALPSGSHLTLYDSTDDDPTFNKAQSGYDDTGAVPYVLRAAEFVTGYFDGLEPVEPGIVPLGQWRPEIEPFERKNDPTLCGVARKP